MKQMTQSSLYLYTIIDTYSVQVLTYANSEINSVDRETLSR